jgi:hypothetical protein
MSFWKKLFGGGSAEEAEAEQGAAEEYKGFLIRAAPFRHEGQFQTAGIVEKEIAGERKEHKFIRADRHASLDDAVAFSLSKARQLVDEQGEQMFRPPR